MSSASEEKVKKKTKAQGKGGKSSKAGDKGPKKVKGKDKEKALPAGENGPSKAENASEVEKNEDTDALRINPDVDEMSAGASDDGDLNFHDADAGAEEGGVEDRQEATETKESTQPDSLQSEASEVSPGVEAGGSAIATSEETAELNGIAAGAKSDAGNPKGNVEADAGVKRGRDNLPDTDNVESSENGQGEGTISEDTHPKVLVSAPLSAERGDADETLPSSSASSASVHSAKRSLWSSFRASTDTSASQASTNGTPVTGGPGLRPRLAASLSNSLSSFAAGLTSQNWAAARRGSSDTVTHERKRLPRRDVDEAQLAEDMIRFADARHVLHTETDIEALRQLGMRLEEGWREKLSQSQELRMQLEEAQDTLEDLQDENEHLRTQLGILSEQIAAREDEFEQFQRSAIEQQAREKHLWKEEAREELENARFKVAEAHRQVAQERSLVSQLRLLLHKVKSGRLDVLSDLEIPDLPSVESEKKQDDSEKDDTKEDSKEGAKDDASTKAKQRHSSKDEAGEAQVEKTGEEVDQDILFNLSQSPLSSRRTTMVTEAQPLHHMKRDGFLSDSIAEEYGAPQSLTVQVLFDKAAADAALTQALQEENLALRSHIDAKGKRCDALQMEVQELQSRLTQTEAAISELLEAAAPT